MTGCTEGQSPDYFRLHINNYSCVETVTCLSSKVRAVLDSMLIKIDDYFLHKDLSKVKYNTPL